MIQLFLLITVQVVNYSESRTAEEICESSSKMITFIDLAGHHKYLKTTIFGLTSYCPDFAMLVVSANTGIGELQRYTVESQTSQCIDRLYSTCLGPHTGGSLHCDVDQPLGENIDPMTHFE